MRKLTLAVVLLASCGVAYAQGGPQDPANAPDRPQTTAPNPNPVPDDADQRDRVLYSDETESVKPLAMKLAGNFLMDQKDIWTSPFHIHGRDAIPWIATAVAAGALIATDH